LAIFVLVALAGGFGQRKKSSVSPMGAGELRVMSAFHAAHRTRSAPSATSTIRG